MAWLRYEPEELPAAVSRTVRWRWPGEQLLVTVPCEAEWPTSTAGWGAAANAGDRSPDAPQLVHKEKGALGVTEARLIYRDLVRHGLPVRVSAWVFAALAALGFLAGGQGVIPLIGAGMAVAAWSAGRAIETFGLGGGWIALGRGIEIDRRAFRIHAVDRWGIHYRLRLAEPDLERVARLVAG